MKRAKRIILLCKICGIANVFLGIFCIVKGETIPAYCSLVLLYISFRTMMRQQELIPYIRTAERMTKQLDDPIKWDGLDVYDQTGEKIIPIDWSSRTLTDPTEGKEIDK